MTVFWWWDLMHQLHRTVGIWLDVVYISRVYVLVVRDFLSWVCIASFSRYWFTDSVLLGLVLWWLWRLCHSLRGEERSSWELLRIRYSGEGYLLEYVDVKCVGVVLAIWKLLFHVLMIMNPKMGHIMAGWEKENDWITTIITILFKRYWKWETVWKTKV